MRKLRKHALSHFPTLEQSSLSVVVALPKERHVNKPAIGVEDRHIA